MTLDDFLEKLKTQPDNIEFDQTMQVIQDNYTFQPTAFNNGPNLNAINTNEGSCRIFAFAKMNNLNPDQTLSCFGKYYCEDVLLHPENNDHANIRQFMKTGFEGIQFNNEPLVKK